MGHFVPARLFKTRVEKFYLFFNPWFSLFKKKIGQTEYGIGWLPLGGYVKIAGMVDESMDKKAMKEPPKPDEFRSKKAWQRLIIMLGGVTVNFIVGILIFWLVLGVWGDVKLPAANVKYGIAADSTAEAIGFRDGDKVLAVDGEAIKTFDRFTFDLILYSARTVEVDREGQRVTITLPKPRDLANKIIDAIKTGYFVEARFPGVVDSVVAGEPAADAGLQKGDELVSLAGVPTAYYHDFNAVKLAHKGDTVAMQVMRRGDTIPLKILIPKDDGVLGFHYQGSDHFLVYDTTYYNAFSAFPAGLNLAMLNLKEYWLQVKLIVSGRVPFGKSVGGFISIGKVFRPHWDWQVFWRMTAWLSLVLAFMNLLPIPALDGGHVMFLLFEVITGRHVPDKVLEYAQVVGMILLLSLIVFANGADILRLFN
jgi:regulator of sigma E protease